MLLFRQLLLIIWKGVLVRKRHFIITGFELLIPLLLIVLFTYLRTLGGPATRELQSMSIDSKFHNATFFLAEELEPFKDSSFTVLYVPNTTVASEFIEKAIGTQESVAFKGFDSDNEMTLYYISETAKGKYNNYYGIVLNNVKDKLPESLDYQIRVTDSLYTGSKYPPSFLSQGPNLNNAYHRSHFLALQNAIDKTFIEFKSKKELNKNTKLYLQRYPYPEYIDISSLMSFTSFMPYFIVYGLCIMMAIFVKRIIEEKTNRAKELMRMMGLNDFVYFLGAFLNTYFLLFFITCVTAILFSISFVKGGAVLDYSNGFIFFILLNLYMISSLLFCMAISTFFNKPVLGSIVTFSLWVASHSIPTNLLDPMGNSEKYAQLKLGAKLAAALLPNCAFHWMCKIIGNFEGSQVGASWSNFNEGSTPDDDLSLAMVGGMMLVSIVVYSFIVWYVDNVWPWQPGIPKNPGFLFMPSYWCPTRSLMKGSYSASFDEYIHNEKYFEAEPQEQAKGILLKSLSKVFGRGSRRKVAVDSVSLAMYKGQITVLLGHNGAGKTTTMNVLTGLYVPSSGTALIDGYDILTSTKKARKSLGLCPQHNVLYDNLTVEEHLKFFAGLKGMSFLAMPSEITSVLNLLDLVSKRTTLSSALSGGMKRKLSLGIAIVGGSKVLVLDEPTSGMDPQARRAVWDLLQKIRTERTVLLTTHYMEEADVLGDRIAIMADGKVQCAGSPLFLKRTFGAGYNLRFAKGDTFLTDDVTDIVKRHVNDAILNSETNREACYILPSNDAEPFADMFDEIERQKDKLGFNSFGLSITTMEDVFLKVGQLSEKAIDNEAVKSSEENSNLLNDARESIIIRKPLLGVHLFMSRVKGLWLKRFHDAKRYKAFLIFQFLLPIVVSVAMLCIIKVVDLASGMDYPSLPLRLNDIFGSTTAFYSGNEQSFVDKYKKVLEQNKANVILDADPIKQVLTVGNNKLIDFKQDYMVSGAINTFPQGGFNLTALYNGEPFHVAALSINLMNTAYLRFQAEDDSKGIFVTNHPFPSTSSNYDIGNNGMDVAIRLLYCCLFPMAISFLSASFVLFPIHERITKSKLIQRMTGINGFLFWTMHFIWDYVVFLIASLFLLITFAATDTNIYGNGSSALGTLFLLLALYGWSAIPFNYILSFKSKKPSSGFIFASSVSSTAGLLLTIAITIFRLADRTPDKADSLAFLFRLVPDFCVTWGAANVHVIGRQNGFCASLDPLILKFFCPVWLKNNPHSLSIKCCPNECGKPDTTPCDKPVPYISWEPTATGRDMLFMGLTGFIYFAILFLLETNFVRVWYAFKTNILPRLSKSSRNRMGSNTAVVQPSLRDFIAEDPDVSQERSRVETLFQAQECHLESLVVMNLSKGFGNFQAVDQLTFAVHKDECFGLLGVNGAGKTTTFGMLTGDLVIGEGNAYIGKHNMQDHRKILQNCLGYCPQFDALLDRMTGTEALYLFARLRGMPASEIQSSVSKIISMVDLKPHANKIAEKYSGGNRRKLSLALALIGGPSVVLLDEPTAGVDPASRRKIWNTFTEIQNIGGMSFILTTHSMDECEALCGRIAIMVNGRFRCLGSLQDLKHKFGQGYTLIVKLQKEQYTSTEHTNAVRQHLENVFSNMHLKDEHQGLLHYHLDDNSIPWSVLFREMEKTKKIFQLEDYLISDTNLEQIFLAFSRGARVVAT